MYVPAINGTILISSLENNVQRSSFCEYTLINMYTINIV